MDEQVKRIPLVRAAPLPAVPDRAGHRAAERGRTLLRSRWSVLAWLLLAAIAALHGWTGRHEMSPDGIAYLDLADAFRRGDWGLAFNRLWSPLYPALLALILGMLRPLPIGEFAAVHLANFAIFLGALAAFEFMLRQVLAQHQEFAVRAAAGRRALPEWFLPLLGYAVFAYASLELTPVALVSPDLLVSVFVYLAIGLLVRMRRPSDRATPVLLGVVSGLGYLAKASMFPLALIFLALGLAPAFRRLPLPRAGGQALAALIPFALVTGSLVLAFVLTGRGVTLGESARLNYAYHINGLPYVHWQGEVPGSGTPAHPTRKIVASPPVYEFAAPVAGTYPPWDDPAYWYEGLRVRFDARAHLSNLARSARVLAGIVARSSQIALVPGALVLLWLGRRPGMFLRDARSWGTLVIPLLAATAVFSLVWLERRFIAPFLAPFWLGVFAPITFAGSFATERAVRRIAVALLAMLVLAATYASTAMARELWARQRADEQSAVALGLQQIGVRPGDGVAIINDWPGGSDASWARLARVRIVAEMPACRAYAGSICPRGPRDGVPAFERAGPRLQNRILRAFAGTGAAAVVMRDADHPALSGWRRIPGTDYNVYLLGHEAAVRNAGAGRWQGR